MRSVLGSEGAVGGGGSLPIPRAPTAVVFDLDGTLIDSRGDIVAAVNHALAKIGKKPLPAVSIVRHVGDGARPLLARCAQLSEYADDVTKMVDAFVAYYCDHPLDFTRWMPGAQEALERLGDMPDMALAVCTNKPRPIVDAVLTSLGVRTRFRAVVAGGDLVEKKPAPAPLLHLCKVLHAHPETMVMVGDAPQDVECAKNAGCRSVGVEGHMGRDRLVDARPDVLIARLDELPDIIRRWRDATTRLEAIR